MKLVAFVVSVLSFSMISGMALAKGKWQEAEGRDGCAIWNPNPLPGEKIYWNVGKCKNGKAHGKGVLVWEYRKEGYNKIDTYIGGMREGRYDGEGRAIYDNGFVRKGVFTKGKHQYGHVYYKNGNIYYGDLEDGILEGKGLLKFNRGGSFKGDFKGGHPNGDGTLIEPNGDRYDGQFENGEPHGIVTVKFVNGVKFRGFFNEGQPDGYGEMTFNSGAVCVGHYGYNFSLKTPGKAHNEKTSQKGICEKAGSNTHFTWN